MRGLKRDSGLTLLELAIAVLVLSIGALAAVRASNQSRVSIGGAQERVLAQLAVRNRAEQLNLFGAGTDLPDSVTLNGQSFAVSTSAKATAGGLQQVTITAQSPAGIGAVLVVFVGTGAGG